MAASSLDRNRSCWSASPRSSPSTHRRSHVLNLEAAADADNDAERVRGILAAIAPIVGTARIAAATRNIVDALAVEIEMAEIESQGDA